MNKEDAVTPLVWSRWAYKQHLAELEAEKRLRLMGLDLFSKNESKGRDKGMFFKRTRNKIGSIEYDISMLKTKAEYFEKRLDNITQYLTYNHDFPKAEDFLLADVLRLVCNHLGVEPKRVPGKLSLEPTKKE